MSKIASSTQTGDTYDHRLFSAIGHCMCGDWGVHQWRFNLTIGTAAVNQDYQLPVFVIAQQFDCL